MYSMAAPHAKGKSAEDNIFAANNRAIALAEKIGVENVVNATEDLFWMKMAALSCWMW